MSQQLAQRNITLVERNVLYNPTVTKRESCMVAIAAEALDVQINESDRRKLPTPRYKREALRRLLTETILTELNTKTSEWLLDQSTDSGNLAEQRRQNLLVSVCKNS
jgi:hypothetical protein